MSPWAAAQAVPASGAAPSVPAGTSTAAPAEAVAPEAQVLTEGQALLLKYWVPRRKPLGPEPDAEVATGAPAPGVASATDSAIRILLEPLGFTTLSSPLDGRIIAVDTGIGRRFGQGAALVSFDCQEQKARLSISRTELRASSEKYQTQLLMKGLDQASEIDVQLAALDVEKNKSQVDLYSFQVRQCSVLAPWDGSTTKLHVRSFMSVNKGTPLLDLVRSGRLKARMNVPSKWLNALQVNSDVKVAVDETQKTYDAKISAINARVDAVSQTVEVEATLNGDFKDLLPGMSGVVQFSGLQ